MGSPARLTVGAAALEECDASVAVQAGRKPDGAGASVKKVRGDRLRNDAATGGDLVEIEVLQVVGEQQFDVAILDLLAGGHVGEIDQGAIEFQDCGNEDMLYAPLRGDRLLREVLSGLGSVALDMAAQRAKVGPEVGQHLAETRFGQVGAIERAEAPADVVESVAELVQLQRSEAERVIIIADPPQGSPPLGRRDHDWKLATCRAARTTIANCAVSIAAPSTSIGAQSSKRVLVPNSHARAVSSS